MKTICLMFVCAALSFAQYSPPPGGGGGTPTNNVVSVCFTGSTCDHVVTGFYTIGATDSVLTCDSTYGAIQFLLPLATASGRRVDIKKLVASNSCSMLAQGSNSIDGLYGFALTALNASSTVIDVSAGASGMWARMIVNAASGPAGPAGPVGPAGPGGTTGIPGVPGFSPNALTSGGQVVWLSGLTFSVGATSYQIGGAVYTSPLTEVTLETADSSNPRIDVIVVDTSLQVVIIKGTAQVNPAKPDIDPDTQLDLTFVYIPAGATTPANVVSALIYDENNPTAEWTAARSNTTFALASTTNPHTGTLDIEASNVVNGQYVKFTSTGNVDLSAYNYLVLNVRVKTWIYARTLKLQWVDATMLAQGAIVSITNTGFGFDSTNTTSYQQIVIPLSLFGVHAPVNQLFVIVGGSGANFGFYLDTVNLQAGMPAPSASTALNQRGVWSATPAYAVNDVVSYGDASWATLIPNTNSVPTCANVNWSIQTPQVCNTKTANYIYAGPVSGSPAAPTFRAPVVLDTVAALRTRSFGANFDGGGAAMTAGKTVYITVPYACTISAWNISVDTGTATIDIWRLASGTSIPTVSNTITASATPAISSNTAIHSTTMTSWCGTGTCAIAANDIIGINLKTVASATFANMVVECDQ